MSLEGKSIYQLRGIAQAVGIKVDWAWDKPKLIYKINNRTAPVPKPIPKIYALVEKGSKQEQIIESIRHLTGVVASFPDGDTWQFNYQKREDSGNIALPLRDIVECAKRLYG